MKKQTIIVIIIAVVLIIAIVIGVVVFNNQKNNKVESSDNSKIETVSQMKKMINALYSKLGDQLPSLETATISSSDINQVKTYTGLQSTDNIEKIVVSEPLMSAQAYLLATVKVKDGADIEKMKQEMLNNLDMRKWICVSAEKLYITNHENTIFMIMSSAEWADPVYNAFKEYVDNKIGKELTKTEEEDIELPPEMIVK